MAGLGRGMPGRPAFAGPPSRAAAGRGGRWSPGTPGATGALGAPGAAGPRSAGAGRRPIPWLGANGLFPGRGAPGRADGRGAGARGAGESGAATSAAAAGAWGAASGAASSGSGLRGPGFGPGRALVWLGASKLAAGAAGTAGSAAAGAGDGALGAAAAGAGVGAAGAAGVGAGAATDFSWSPYCFLNRISTGGSTVDDADLTNSPISLSFSRTNLLSTPNSFASSWTRTLATLLLLVRAPDSQLIGWGDADR